MKIKSSELEKAIMSELKNYSQEITDMTKDVIMQTSKECVSEIKQNSPIKTGKYKRGWRVKKMHESYKDIRLVVHNTTSYQLAHLLEYGHQHIGYAGKGPDGEGKKQVLGRIKGKPHITPAFNNVERKLEGRIKAGINKWG